MVRARFFIEYLGNNPDAITSRIRTSVKQIRERFNVIEEIIGEPDEIQRNVYSCYLEIVIDFDSLEDLFGFILDFTPTVVEVLSPDKITLSISEFQNLLNDFASKVRTVAWAARELWAENQLLKRKISEIISKKKHK